MKQNYEISASKEPLAAEFIQNIPVYWTTASNKSDTEGFVDYERFLSINPSEYQTYDVILPEKKVSGLELRQNLAIYSVGRLFYSKENANGELISPNTKREFNKVLFGSEFGPETPADKEHAKTVLNRMNDVVKGFFRAENAKQTGAVQHPEVSDDFLKQALAYVDSTQPGQHAADVASAKSSSIQEMAKLAAGNITLPVTEANEVSSRTGNSNPQIAKDLTLPFAELAAGSTPQKTNTPSTDAVVAGKTTVAKR